ncbi:apolipoprotein N-acyltransferase [Actinocrispum sp. NPDC049592]|uniref:apolipoprotein N-acyltransferase n=1 Tax=Actinocrispum sp. NPDC049592 TaxID=3154835 RepID=UPI003427A807
MASPEPLAPEPQVRGSFLGRHPAVWRMAAAAVAGALLWLSFPPRNWWWLAPLAFALFAVTIYRRRARAGFGYGLIFGFVFLASELFWLQDFLGSGFGPAPWVGLSLASAGLVALGTTGMAVVSKLPGGPVWMAMLFVADEALRQRFPFDGFPWARVAFGQPEGLFLPLAALGGAPLVTFGVVLTGCAIAALVLNGGRRAFAVMAVIPLLVGTGMLPLVNRDDAAGSVTIGIVQGNGPEGLSGIGSGAEMRQNHLVRAEQLAQDIKAGRMPKPDIVILPETFTDLGPDPAEDRQIAQVVSDLGVPTLIGGRITRPDGAAQNVMIVWDPVKGPGQEYSKQKLVPFGEFVPMRSIARIFTPFVDDQKDMRPGTQPPVLTAAGVPLGVAICFEVAYDDVLETAARDGAQVLTVPTNNAWFGRTEMSYQQEAMSRVRAVEHDRAVIISATTGVSAVIQPDGGVTRQTELYTGDTLVATVPKKTTVTLATRIGAWPEGAMVAGGFAALLWAAGSRVRRRRVDSSREER